MVVLNTAQRKDAARKWIQKVFVEMNQTATLDTVQIRAAIDATDAWIEANQASFNAAVPEPFKSLATSEQKTLLFVYVAMKRAGLI